LVLGLAARCIGSCVWRLTVLLLVSACEAKRPEPSGPGTTLDPRVVARWPYRFTDATGETRWIQVGTERLAIHFASTSDRRVLADFLALDADVVTECSSRGSDCAGDCLFVFGRFDPTLQFSETSPEGSIAARWGSAQPFVEFELTGFEVLTPFRSHVWTGRDMEAHWTHGDLTTLEAKHFGGREVNPALYRRARPR
jgi:hypothetical protein